MQKNSQAAFATLISSFSKSEQEKIWNLTRYDYLISDLASSPKKSEKEIKVIILNYPVEIQKTAIEEHKKNYKVLVQIDEMNKSYVSDFELLLNNYPPEVINTFREMIQMPEVLDILNDNMPYTVVVGNYYKKNPDRILHKTDSLNLILTQKNKQEAEDWKQSMSEDPQAQKEYVKAAQEYAQSNGYQPDIYNSPMTEYDADYNPTPYTWWFGYPTWYPDNSWNPNPYWQDWGFYFGKDKQVVFTGLPSSYFMDWYFYYPEHFSKYAVLSNHYYDYYNRHSGSMNSNSVSHRVNEWRNTNKEIVTGDWNFDKTNRVERFRQYGDLEVSRRNYNNRNPKQQISRTDFAQRTPNRYYFLAADVAKRPDIQGDTKTTSVQENSTKPARRPTVTLPVNYTNARQPVNINTQPSNNESRQRQENVNNSSRSTNQVVNPAQMRNAEQYNQNAWRQPQQAQPQQNRTSTSPSPRQPQQSQPQQNRSTPLPSPTPSPRQPEIRQVVEPVRTQPTRQITPVPGKERSRQ
jgi:hypothetical protein